MTDTPRKGPKCPACGTKTIIDVEPFEGTIAWCPKCKKVRKLWPID